MKNIIARFLIGLSVLIIMYLIVSFVKLTFDFTNWSEGTRFFLSVFGTVLALFVALAPYEIEKL
jgi:hypothetical protein